MNEQEKRQAEINKRFDDIFGDEDGRDDVSLESAREASQKPAVKTVEVEVYDTELGFVTEKVTVQAATPSVKPGTLAAVIAQYGETFPENVVVMFTNWKGTRRITSVSNVGKDSCGAIIDGSKTTLNPNAEVTVTVN